MIENSLNLNGKQFADEPQIKWLLILFTALISAGINIIGAWIYISVYHYEFTLGLFASFLTVATFSFFYIYHKTNQSKILQGLATVSLIPFLVIFIVIGVAIISNPQGFFYPQSNYLNHE